LIYNGFRTFRSVFPRLPICSVQHGRNTGVRLTFRFFERPVSVVSCVTQTTHWREGGMLKLVIYVGAILALLQIYFPAG